MIEWNCNFALEDSTIQLGVAHVKVVEYININARSEVAVIITDETGEIIVKEYKKLYDRTFNNDKEIYEELLEDFENSKIL
jgi:bifunctional DNA-binding transcriptional regulator/antitoxin component of YhaV-PrlF toxin-antitoxin module